MFQKVFWLENYEPYIELYYSNDCNSTIPNHRILIRDKIIQLLTDRKSSKDELLRLKDLNKLPCLENFSISLSHSEVGSIIAICPKTRIIGVDIEKKPRITDTLIKRISNKKEIEISPQTSFLFPAKEAIWKAISTPHKPLTISSIHVTSWKQLSTSLYQFNASAKGKELSGQGYLYRQPKYLISTFSQEIKS